VLSKLHGTCVGSVLRVDQAVRLGGNEALGRIISGAATPSEIIRQAKYLARERERLEMGGAASVTDAKQISGNLPVIHNGVVSCAKCRRHLTPAETVWRAAILLGFDCHGNCRKAVKTLCEGCAPQGQPTEARTCGVCRRPVMNVIRWSGRNWGPLQVVFCGDRCARRRYARFARQRRAEARRIVCVTCGRAFAGKRMDAAHCGAACRQQAYRRRAAGRGGA